MAQYHIATCQVCGEQFDTFRGGYYNRETKQYTCKRCGRSGNRTVRGYRIGMRQTRVGMVLKILFGLMFLAISVRPAKGDTWDLSYFFTCVIFGVGTIALAIIPWIKARNEQKDLFLQDEQASAEIRRKAKEYASAPKICPGCGATGTGSVCEYCGTKLG